MPIYLFENPQTGEIVEKYFGMNEEKILVVDNIKYNRIYVAPNAAKDTQVDPFSAKDFVKATDKKGTVGDLIDRSAELSHKRIQKDGVDTVKEKYYENYAKERRGSKHPDVIKRESNKKLAKLGVTLS